MVGVAAGVPSVFWYIGGADPNLLQAAQREGRLNPGLDPRLLVVSLVGLTLFPAAGAPIWRQLFDAQDLDADALSRHTIALLQGGIGVA